MPRVTIELTELELQELDRRAESAGMTREEFARHIVVQRIGRRPEPGTLGSACYDAYRDGPERSWTDVAEMVGVGVGGTAQQRADLARNLAKNHADRRRLPWPLRSRSG